MRGSWLALCTVAAAFDIYLVTTGLAVTALCRTVLQANAVVNVGTLLVAGLAGALIPYSLLPSWARDIAPVVPSYWAMQGYTHAIFGEGASVIEPILFLIGFAIVSLLTAFARFRLSDEKVGLV